MTRSRSIVNHCLLSKPERAQWVGEAGEGGALCRAWGRGVLLPLTRDTGTVTRGGSVSGRLIWGCYLISGKTPALCHSRQEGGAAAWVPAARWGVGSPGCQSKPKSGP